MREREVVIEAEECGVDWGPVSAVREAGFEGGRHQLRRAVAYANFGKLRFKTEHEQQIWGECSRLITNCIIFYNAMLLSRLLQHAESKGDEEATAALEKVSPVAWQRFKAVVRHSFDLPTSLSPAKGCEKCSQSNQGARGRLGDKSDGGVGVGVAVGIDHQALGQEECLGDDGLVEIKQVVIVGVV